MEPTIFRGGDIQGLYGPGLDETTAYLLGRAIGTRVGAGARWPSAPTCGPRRGSWPAPW